jgi:hypothetical protein
MTPATARAKPTVQPVLALPHDPTDWATPPITYKAGISDALLRLGNLEVVLVSTGESFLERRRKDPSRSEPQPL